MHPYIHAKKNPNKPALIMASSGEITTYKELDERSNQIAHLFRQKGLKIGDGISIFMENNSRFLEICWAAQRSGLYFTPISSKYLKNVANETFQLTKKTKHHYMVDGVEEGWQSFENAIMDLPKTPIPDEEMGQDMLYSSGTTGKPKGIRVPLKHIPIDQSDALMSVIAPLYDINENTKYLSPAPLYHAAPLRFTMRVNYLGGTNIIMENFDAEMSLSFIEKYKINMSQWVPTMFVRMCKLPESIRTKYDLSTHECAIHAAAPCPIEIKKTMIEWWGEIINEFYAGSEGNGFFACNSKEWLDHVGTVGKPIFGIPHICDEEGNELPIGSEGTIWFESDVEFSYHNDKKKTLDTRHPKNPKWTTLGDIGKLDEDNYLYLTDRKAFMIISGGVNIYPQETEDLIITHPKVYDCAVIGVPNQEFGEEVKAVVQPISWNDVGKSLEEEIIHFCRNNLSSIKCPKTVDFEKELPRHPTGKLYKRLLKDRYWGKKDSKIV